MKTLNEYIEERLIIPSQVDEKLVINKDYKSINNDDKIVRIINDLFDNHEYSDFIYDEVPLHYRRIIEDIIDITFEGYGNSEIKKMKDIVLNKNFKFMPKDIKSDEYKRALRKLYVDVESKYNDEINDLYKLVKEYTSEFTTREVDLLDNNVFTLSISEQFIIVFTNNKDTTEIFDLFIIEM